MSTNLYKSDFRVIRNKGLRSFAAVGAVVFAISMFGNGVLGQVIRLRESVAVEGRQDVRLGDIATVTGADAKTAEGLANLVILPDVRESRALRAEAVLVAVIAQLGPSGLADKLQVAGAANCSLKVATRGQGSAAGARKTEESKTVAAPETVAPVVTASAVTVKEIPGEATTLAKLLVAEVRQNLNVEPEDFRISFATFSPLLDQAIPVNGPKKWVFRSLTRNPLGTVQFDAQLVEGGRVLQKLNVQASVQKRAKVLVSTALLAKGDVVTKDHFREEEVWLDRQMPTLLANEKDVIGLEALRAVGAGAMLDQRDFRPVEMAARGDAVAVVFVSGNLQVKMRGEALESGKLNDFIQVKSEGTKDVYGAKLIAKRLAVVGNVDEATEKKLREAK